MTRNITRRVPVVYKDTPLMPMRWGRAMKYIQLGKAKFKLHRKLRIKYLELLVKPSDMKTQKLVLGFDPGSVYDGFSVVSEQCHHENFELIHNKNIKIRMKKRRKNRGLRRNKLRHRENKFNHRTQKKMVPTLRSRFDFRAWLFTYIIKLYPISQVAIEKPSFNFYKKKYNKYASLVVMGLEKFVNHLKLKNESLEIIKFRGWNTKERRLELFNTDKKSFSKSNRSFYSHCLDSYCLSSLVTDSFPVLNTKTKFISKIWFNKRELYQEKMLYSKYDPCRCYYRKYKAGGKIEYLNPYYGKKRTVKLMKYSNSFKEFQFILLNRELKYHKIRTHYGGTVYNGISKYGRYQDLVTKEIIHPKNALLCNLIYKKINSYNLVGYKRQNLEAVM